MKKLYTSTGDDGYTSLLREGRVPKYHDRIEAIGALDEAFTSLGLARSLCKTPQIPPAILVVQKDIMTIMTEIAASPENVSHFHQITSSSVDWLEKQIAEISEKVSIPQEFIIPGDVYSSAALSFARTVVRRAERRVAYLFHKQEIQNHFLLRYLNRLSTLCFAWELLESQGIQKADPEADTENNL